jgi:DNA polymerase elongation subunit (family B)
MLYSLDIETYTGEGDGLNPFNPTTRITSASIYYGPESGDGPEGVFSLDDPNERRLIWSIDDFFASRETPSGTIVTWGGANFDGPFLSTRSMMLGLSIGLEMMPTNDRPWKYGPCAGHNSGYLISWWGHDHVDVSYSYVDLARKAGVSASLKPVSRLMGLNPIEVDRERMEALTVAERTAYNVSDVEMTYRLALLTPDLKSRCDSLEWER